MAEHENEQGMSTTKRVAAGAAVGLAVPAAIGVARKIMGSDDEDVARRTGERRTQSPTGRARRATRRATTSAKSQARSAGSKAEKTKEQLYRQAQRLKIEGRSKMSKAQLERAVSRARS